MELHTLIIAPGSRKKKKRVGRGEGTGQGGTSRKGHKGAQSRSGYKTRPYFEGGQTPLHRRVGKFGFKNPNRVAYKPINIATLEKLVAKYNLEKIDREVLRKYGLVRKNEVYKILGEGNLTKKIEVVASAFSTSAKEAIEKGGGSTAICN